MDPNPLTTPDFWKHFTVSKEVSLAFHATGHTVATLLDLRKPSSDAGPLTGEGLLKKLGIVVSKGPLISKNSLLSKLING
jgi:hypothetical protein